MLDGKPLIQLPAKHVELVELEFSEEERAVYSMVEQKARRADLTFADRAGARRV